MTPSGKQIETQDSWVQWLQTLRLHSSYCRQGIMAAEQTVCQGHVKTLLNLANAPLNVHGPTLSANFAADTGGMQEGHNLYTHAAG